MCSFKYKITPFSLRVPGSRSAVPVIRDGEVQCRENLPLRLRRDFQLGSLAVPKFERALICEGGLGEVAGGEGGFEVVIESSWTSTPALESPLRKAAEIGEC